MDDKQITHGLMALELEFGRDTVARAKEAVGRFTVEVPSWVFGDFGGGRFSGYLPSGPARNLAEKLDDAAEVNRLTGATERVAMHVLWDFSNDGMKADQALAVRAGELAGERGLEIGAVNPTYFLTGSHQGSLSAPDADLRKRYIDQTVLSAQIAIACSTPSVAHALLALGLKYMEMAARLDQPAEPQQRSAGYGD